MSERRLPPALEAKRRADGDEELTKGDLWKLQRQRADRATGLVAVLFIVSILAAIGLLVVYVQGGNTQLEGLLLFAAFSAIGTGLTLWARVVIAEPQVVEERIPLRQDAERQKFSEAFGKALGEGGPDGRRRFLVRLLSFAGGAIGLSLFIPIRSLGPGPESELFRTSWARGKRLVDLEGHPVNVDDVVDDQVITVFPEGAVGSADSQALLIGLRGGESRDLPEETVGDLVCYSKVCTHAGCPVGLYRARDGELICPCHQSTFNVYEGAKPVAGPAARALPQLPLGTDADGNLVALGDFPSPIGPAFWNMTDVIDRADQAVRDSYAERDAAAKEADR